MRTDFNSLTGMNLDDMDVTKGATRGIQVSDFLSTGMAFG